MPILKLEPAYKDYIWGGAKLISAYNKAYAGERLAETWELSTHPHGQSIISGGGYDGMCLREYIEKNPLSLGNTNTREDLPILIKLIDAKQPLSIQVHPDDQYAYAHENSSGKTEMWIILSCETDAFIYCGFEKKVSKEIAAQHIQNNTITDILKKIKVNKGDVFFIEAGTIHAIGAGIVIAEIQQNSDLTYRVYDYNRLGVDGKPRELHTEKVLAAANFDVANYTPPGMAEKINAEEYQIQRLTKNPLFVTEILSLRGIYERKISAESFLSIICIDGLAQIYDGALAVSIKKGDSFFVPAEEKVISFEGTAEFILTTLC